MGNHFGAIPDNIIRELIEGKFISGAQEQAVRPASLDLTLATELYRIEDLVLPHPGESVRDLLSVVGAEVHPYEIPLERNITYLARLEQTLRLPEAIYGYCNPKSSSGRIDLHVRVLADGVPRYDSVTPAGFQGELWSVISPKSFPIRLAPTESLTQLRLFNRDTRFEEWELQIAFEPDKLLWHTNGDRAFRYEEVRIRDADGSVILTPDLSGEIVGWESVTGNRVLDFSKIGHYHPTDFFRPLAVSNGTLKLRQGAFYILKTKERIRVPPHLSCEMVPMDPRNGEFRSHYAGFIDPGWGWGQDGEGAGRPLVLEVRPFEPIRIREKQAIAKIVFERMAGIPERRYDTMRDSHYTNQEFPRLSKHFIQL